MPETPDSWNHLFPHWSHPILPSARLKPYVTAQPIDSDEIDFARAIESNAKVELHVHMEAAVPATFYDELSARRQIFERPKAPYANFRAFIKAWMATSQLLQSAADFRDLARAFVRDRAAQNIVYTEAHISPLDVSVMRLRFPDRAQALELSEVLAQVVLGIRDGEHEWPHVTVKLIVDALYPASATERDVCLDALRAVVHSEENRNFANEPIIVGVGLGGPELVQNAPAAKIFLDECRELGLGVDVHSGETVSASEHQHSIAILQPDRIAHGIAAANEDWFFAGHISCCPLSNLQTGCFAGPLSEHPVERLFRSGANFSINTDDPLFFQTTLTLEYVALRRAFQFDWEFFVRTQKNARRSVFCAAALTRVLKTDK